MKDLTDINGALGQGPAAFRGEQEPIGEEKPMLVVRSMDGKFYDIPDDQASQFEVPRERVKGLLEKMGTPAPQGGPGDAGQGAPGPMQPPMQDGAPGGAPGAGPSVLVQSYGSPQTPAMATRRPTRRECRGSHRRGSRCRPRETPPRAAATGR